MANRSRALIELTQGVCCAPLQASPLAEDEAIELAKVFAALGDPVRLRLLSLIAENDEVCSCDLQEPLGKSQPTVSHHTKVLAEAGLIVGEKRGRWVWWSVVPDRPADLRASLPARPTPPPPRAFRSVHRRWHGQPTPIPDRPSNLVSSPAMTR